MSDFFAELRADLVAAAAQQAAHPAREAVAVDRLRDERVSRRRPDRLFRRRWLLAPAAVAAVAVAAVIASTSGLDEGRVGPAESAAALLTRAAEAAERAPAPGALAPGEYLYVRRTAMEPRVIERAGLRFTVFIRYVNEDWTTRNGSGRSLSRPAPPSFPTARDRATWQRAGSPNNREMVGNYLPILEGTDLPRPAWRKHAFPARSGGAGLSYAQVRALPTDPKRLEARLRSEIGSLREFTPDTRAAVARLRLLERVGSLLGGAPLDAAQRAALFRVAASQPGVRLSTDALDRLGRRGTAVRLDVRAVHNPARPPYQRLVTVRTTSFVFEPSTGALLGTRHLLRDDTRRNGGDYGAVYQSGVVRSTSARPRNTR